MAAPAVFPTSQSRAPLLRRDRGVPWLASLRREMRILAGESLGGRAEIRDGGVRDSLLQLGGSSGLMCPATELNSTFLWAASPRNYSLGKSRIAQHASDGCTAPDVEVLGGIFYNPTLATSLEDGRGGQNGRVPRNGHVGCPMG